MAMQKSASAAALQPAAESKRIPPVALGLSEEEKQKLATFRVAVFGSFQAS